MKQALCLLAVTLALTVLRGICWAEDNREDKPRFKGVELYSWKDRADNWVFVLLSGTNRLKTEEEVKGSKNLLKCADDLKKELGRLAVGEQVVWAHRINGFAFPPEATLKEIEKAAREAKITLQIVAERK
jgi:hypothetical protein